MKKKLFRLLSIIASLSISFYACRNHEENNNNEDIFQLSKVGTLKLPLDSLAPNSGYHSKLWIDDKGKEWLYAIYARCKRVPVYDLTMGKIDKFISSKKEGPDGVGRILNAEIYNPDSILILPVSRIRLYLINSLGKKLFTYNLIVGRRKEKSWLPSGSAQVPTLYKEDFYYSFTPDLDMVRRKYELQVPIFAHTVTNDSVARLLGVRYPGSLSETSENETFTPEYIIVSYVIQDEKLVYTVPAVDTLYTFDFTTKKKKGYPAPSKFSEREFKTLSTNEITPNLIYRQNYEGTFYYRILYDKYRKVYYRIILLPMEAPKNILNHNTFQAKPFSIQVFDTAFNIIGETLFSKDRFKSNDYFIGKKGLYISNNNAENPDYNEDSLNYSIYVPEIIK